MASKRKWSYSSYGKSALGASIELKGFDELLSKLEKQQQNIGPVIIEALEKSAELVEKSMKEGASRHKRTGAVLEAIEKQPVEVDGNIYSVTVGINLKKNPQAIHGVFQEYGAPHFPAEPFIRPAFDNNKAKIKKLQKETIEGYLKEGE